MELTSLYTPLRLLLGCFEMPPFSSPSAAELGMAGAVTNGQGVCLKVRSHGPASDSADNGVTWEGSRVFSLMLPM